VNEAGLCSDAAAAHEQRWYKQCRFPSRNHPDLVPVLRAERQKCALPAGRSARDHVNTRREPGKPPPVRCRPSSICHRVFYHYSLSATNANNSSDCAGSGLHSLKSILKIDQGKYTRSNRADSRARISCMTAPARSASSWVVIVSAPWDPIRTTSSPTATGISVGASIIIWSMQTVPRSVCAALRAGLHHGSIEPGHIHPHNQSPSVAIRVGRDVI